MSFNWSSYLALAQQLGGGGDADRRSAISRAYYYAFHVANDHLKANKVALNMTKGAHERVWDIFNKSSQVGCQKIGTVGYRLKAARTDADYTAGKNPTPNLVQKCIQDAQNIVHDVPLHVPESFIEPPMPMRCKLVNGLRKLLGC